jgi:hypothetical protein
MASVTGLCGDINPLVVEVEAVDVGEDGEAGDAGEVDVEKNVDAEEGDDVAVVAVVVVPGRVGSVIPGCLV